MPRPAIGSTVITDKTVDAVLDTLEKKGYVHIGLSRPGGNNARQNLLPQADLDLAYQNPSGTYRVAIHIAVEGPPEPEPEPEPPQAPVAPPSRKKTPRKR
jgi:hypothetical protein